MKKILFIMFFLCWTVPFTADAEEFLNTAESFQLAKTGKLGRGTTLFTAFGAVSVNKKDAGGQGGGAQVAHYCGEFCTQCDTTSGTCNKCENNRYLRKVESDNTCFACPANATCDGRLMTCNNGYYKPKNSWSCSACSTIPIEHGTCKACNAKTGGCTSVQCESGYMTTGTSCTNCQTISVVNGLCTKCHYGTCDAVQCVGGYYASGTQCKACSTISVANGTCTDCNAKTGACTAVSCNTGYYSVGNACASCSKIAIENGTCTACSGGDTCTAVTCDSGYTASDTSCVANASCVASTNCQFPNGTCTTCSNGVCTAGTCNSGYAFRKRRTGGANGIYWEAGCYPTATECSSYGSGATCHFIDTTTGNGQCKTDNSYSGTVCTACPTGTKWVKSDTNVCGHGTCQATSCSDNWYDGNGCLTPWTGCNPWKGTGGGHYWNADGQHTIPSSGVKCWDGYGAHSEITVPEGAKYQAVQIRFWQQAQVSGSFTTDYLLVFNGGSSTVKFVDAVTAPVIGMLKGHKVVFAGGLNGFQKCIYKNGQGNCTCSGNPITCQ